MIGAALRWVVAFVRSPLGRAAVDEITELARPGDSPHPLPFAAVQHQREQAARAAHAFPPTLPPSAPPSAPPGCDVCGALPGTPHAEACRHLFPPPSAPPSAPPAPACSGCGAPLRWNLQGYGGAGPVLEHPEPRCAWWTAGPRVQPG